jgi:hypothetical protein
MDVWMMREIEQQQQPAKATLLTMERDGAIRWRSNLL